MTKSWNLNLKNAGSTDNYSDSYYKITTIFICMWYFEFLFSAILVTGKACMYTNHAYIHKLKAYIHTCIHNKVVLSVARLIIVQSIQHSGEIMKTSQISFGGFKKTVKKGTIVVAT